MTMQLRHIAFSSLALILTVACGGDDDASFDNSAGGSAGGGHGRLGWHERGRRQRVGGVKRG